MASYKLKLVCKHVTTSVGFVSQCIKIKSGFIFFSLGNHFWCFLLHLKFFDLVHLPVFFSCSSASVQQALGDTSQTPR